MIKKTLTGFTLPLLLLLGNSSGTSVTQSKTAQGQTGTLKQLIVEKLPSGDQFDLAVRDARTSFRFFNIEGHQYEYNPEAQILSIQGGRLLISNQFAEALGRARDAGATVGTISV